MKQIKSMSKSNVFWLLKVEFTNTFVYLTIVFEIPILQNVLQSLQSIIAPMTRIEEDIIDELYEHRKITLKYSFFLSTLSKKER